jgi:Protein phosphatase 2C
MSADTPQPPAPHGPPQRSWWQWLMGFLFWDDHGPVENPPGYRPILGSRKSRGPPSPLADAYAKAAAEAKAHNLTEGPPTDGEEGRPPLPRKPPPPPAWKVLEPSESSDPVPHTERKLEPGAPGWSLIGASVRGKQHAHQALWRDDAFAWGTAGAWTFAAVCDGAGSAKLSRIGARVASAAAVKSLMAGLTDVRPEEKIRLEECLVDAARAARTEIRNESLRRNCDEREFHATMLLAAVAEMPLACSLGVLQVGDGAIGVLFGGQCVVLGESDSGAYSGETRFLTTFEIDEEWEKRVTLQTLPNVQAVALMTDGVADDFFPESERLIELFEAESIAGLKAADGGPVRGLFRGPLKDPRGGESLAEWLGYEKRGSFDDRTLVVMFRSGSGNQDSGAREEKVNRQFEDGDGQTSSSPTPES